MCIFFLKKLVGIDLMFLWYVDDMSVTTFKFWPPPKCFLSFDPWSSTLNKNWAKTKSITHLLGQWLTFWTSGDSIFSRENKPFKRLFFRVQDGSVSPGSEAGEFLFRGWFGARSHQETRFFSFFFDFGSWMWHDSGQIITTSSRRLVTPNGGEK